MVQFARISCLYMDLRQDDSITYSLIFNLYNSLAIS